MITLSADHAVPMTQGPGIPAFINKGGVPFRFTGRHAGGTWGLIRGVCTVGWARRRRRSVEAQVTDVERKPTVLQMEL